MRQTGNITPADIEQMVYHWLATPAGSYLGSSYGNNIKDALQRPMLDLRMDEVIDKLQADLPILKILGAGAVNLMAYQSDDGSTVELVLEVAGINIQVSRG